VQVARTRPVLPLPLPIEHLVLASDRKPRNSNVAPIFLHRCPAHGAIVGADGTGCLLTFCGECTSAAHAARRRLRIGSVG
jgi:hypothetical protein